MEKLQMQWIFEVLGRPAADILDALKLLIKKLEGEKGVRVFEKKFHDVIPVKDGNNLFTTFVEITLEIDSLDQLTPLLMGYMPAHAELIYPEKITLDNGYFNQLTNLLLQRLHQYDAVTKNALAEREILARELKARAPELFAQDKKQVPQQQEKKSKKKTARTTLKNKK